MNFITAGNIRFAVTRIIRYFPSGGYINDAAHYNITFDMDGTNGFTPVWYASKEERDREIKRIDAMLLKEGGENEPHPYYALAEMNVTSSKMDHSPYKPEED